MTVCHGMLCRDTNVNARVDRVAGRKRTSIIMEVLQVAQQLVLVACKDVYDALRFVGIGNKHLRGTRTGSIITPTEPNQT